MWYTDGSRVACLHIPHRPKFALWVQVHQALPISAWDMTGGMGHEPVTASPIQYVPLEVSPKLRCTGGGGGIVLGLPLGHFGVTVSPTNRL